MALFDEYFDASFDRQGSAFNQLFGTYVGTLLKENKEQYARELKALDPSGELKILSDLRKQRRSLMGDLAGLSRGGDTFTTSFREGGSDAAKEELRLQERNKTKSDNYRTAVGATSAILGVALGQELKDLDENDSKFDDYVSLNIARLIKEAQSVRGASASTRTREGKHGVADAVIAFGEQNNFPKDKQDAIKAAFTEDYKATDADRAVYEDPEKPTPRQKQLLKEMKEGTRTRGSRTRRGSGLPSDSLSKSIIAQIKLLDDQIKAQEKRYREAKDEYLDLARNPGRNFATAPLGSRPSRLSRALDVYGDFRSAAPQAAERMLKESVDAGELTVSDRFAFLAESKDSLGSAPIDVILNRSKNIELIGSAPEGTRLKSTDLDLIRGSLEQMRDASNAPIFGSQNLGEIKFPNGSSLPFNEYLDIVVDNFDKVPSFVEKQGKEAIEKYKTQNARIVSKQIVDWSKTQDESKIKEARTKHNAGKAVSDSINRIQVAKQDFDRTRDRTVLNETIANEYNQLNSTSSELRGDIGNAFLKQVDEFMATPARQRRVDLLSSDLNDLKTTADKLITMPSTESEGAM